MRMLGGGSVIWRNIGFEGEVSRGINCHSLPLPASVKSLKRGGAFHSSCAGA